MDDFPIKTTIYRGFSMAMLNNQIVIAATHDFLPLGDHEWLGNPMHMDVYSWENHPW